MRTIAALCVPKQTTRAEMWAHFMGHLRTEGETHAFRIVDLDVLDRLS